MDSCTRSLLGEPSERGTGISLNGDQQAAQPFGQLPKAGIAYNDDRKLIVIKLLAA